MVTGKKPGWNKINPAYREYLKDARIKEWLATLKATTRISYAWHLFALCDGLGITGSQLLFLHRKRPKALYPKVIGFFSNSNTQKSINTKATIRSGLVSFLETYNEEIPRIVAIRLKKALKKPMTVAHPLIKWEDAEKIISLADTKYQPVFRLMQWGLDCERFISVNNDKAALKAIHEQLEDEKKDFIRIPIGSRKTNPSAFYVLVPRQIAAYLPVLGNDSKPISSKYNVWHAWRIAMHRAGIREHNHSRGPHNLRATFLTEATKRGLEPVLREFQLGHTVDGMNYQRIMQDETWVLEQFRKAWELQPAATKQETEKLAKENQELSERLNIQGQLIEQLTSAIHALQEAKTRSSY